jgi:protein SCO1
MRCPLMFSVLLAAVLAAGCNKEQGESLPLYTHESLADSQQRFQVTGLVVELNPAESTVTLKHDEIPGYMSAMTMPFTVQNTNLLAGIEPGDLVSFRLIVNTANGYIDQLEKIAPGTNTIPSRGSFHRAPEVEPLALGEIVPPRQFTNQLGETFSTADFKGKALAIEFLFTRCPFPTFCPYLASTFQTVQTNLLAATNGPTNWQLLTLSFDPGFDTPGVLKVFGENHGYDPTHWTLATGDISELTGLGEQFGLTFWQDGSGSISHNLRVAVINASGRLQKVFTGNSWTAEDLQAEIVKATQESQK